MSAIFIDGFDHYGLGSVGSTAMLTGPWVEVPTVSGSPFNGPNIPTWGTRTGLYALQGGPSALTGGTQYRTALSATKTNILVSFGFSLSNLPTVAASQGVCSFRDSNNVALADLWITTTGGLELRGPYAGTLGAGNPGTVLASSAVGLILPQVWYFLEMQIDTSAHTFTLRINDFSGTNTPVITATGLTFGVNAVFGTIATSPMVSVAFLMQKTATAPTVTSAWIDDLYIRDNSGTINNSFVGSTHVATIYPASTTIIPPASFPNAASFSPFSLLPVTMTVVPAIAIVTTANQVGGGTAHIQPSFIGPLAGIRTGVNHTLTTSTFPSTYYTDIFQVSPDVGGILTPTTLANSHITLTPTTTGSAPNLVQVAELIVYQVDVRPKTRQWSWSFVLDGHTFYVLDLGQEGTFAFDTITKQWCHLYTQGFGGQWNFANGTMWGDRIIAGDLLYNIAWELDPNQANDEGWRLIKHVVTGGVSTRSREWSSCGFLRLVGSSGQVQSTLPVILTLNFSDDNGKTWSPDYPIEIDPGDVELDIQWPALGSFSTPGRIFKITDQGGLIRIDGADASLGNFKNSVTDQDR